MRDRVVAALAASADLYHDLAAALPRDSAERDLGVRSNTIGSQLWCVVGARESYTRALVAGEWAGFSCSLTSEDVGDITRIAAALDHSASEMGSVLSRLDWSEAREDLVLALLQHEAQHQGQLIRYLYARDYEIPQSWKDRWTLD